MKYIKKFEFNINDIGKNEHIYADFSPRMGTLLIIKNNDLCYFYFHEAYRLILNYLEDNIIKSTSPLNLMNLIYNYITSQVSTLTKSQILNKSSISNKKINSSDKLILNTIKKLTINDLYNLKIEEIDYFTDLLNLPQGYTTFNIIDLNDMIFFYNGFKLDINTKKWLPDKNTNIYSLSNKKDIRIDKYDFQKEFIDIDNNNALKIPKNILNSDIYNEYEYIFNTKKYNI